jgi:hypothetical protein
MSPPKSPITSAKPQRNIAQRGEELDLREKIRQRDLQCNLNLRLEARRAKRREKERAKEELALARAEKARL